ncbi:hypothetical protein [Yinghuangia soli]|uniref:Uncharacterized protein n=1 Tax=Yinghuangia soli TaxID=2908204 RepID=A0AA41Q989_9ACTN|nr:hypothetical protein [Yinghuangia soli]MCF2533270.1 hypothetical protein [Yinghuangia soli]
MQNRPRNEIRHQRRNHHQFQDRMQNPTYAPACAGGDTPARPRTRRPRSGAAATAAAAAAFVLALALAGCSSSDGDGSRVASAATPSASSPGGSASPSGSSGSGDSEEQKMLRHSQCMRENGVPDFPDPVMDGKGGAGISLPEGTDINAVKKAEAACKKFAPGGGENKPINPEAAKRNREISKCMRENGVPNFPDPSADGTLQIEATPGSGMEPGNAAFEEASKKCNMLGQGGGSTNQVKP